MEHATHKTLFKMYISGFFLSLFLTFAAYFLVMGSGFNNSLLTILILILGILQLIVQLIFFLHLSQESTPRWNLIFFVSTVGVVLIVVVGSLWIMQHLNYNMTPQEIRAYVKDQDAF